MENRQVFWPWSSFRMSAWTVPRTVESVQSRIFCDFLVGRLAAIVFSNLSICWSMAVLRNIARMVGAGPLMVMETDVAGAHRSKPL